MLLAFLKISKQENEGGAGIPQEINKFMHKNLCREILREDCLLL